MPENFRMFRIDAREAVQTMGTYTPPACVEQEKFLRAHFFNQYFHNSLVGIFVPPTNKDDSGHVALWLWVIYPKSMIGSAVVRKWFATCFGEMCSTSQMPIFDSYLKRTFNILLRMRLTDEERAFVMTALMSI